MLAATPARADSSVATPSCDSWQWQNDGTSLPRDFANIPLPRNENLSLPYQTCSSNKNMWKVYDPTRVTASAIVLSSDGAYVVFYEQKADTFAYTVEGSPSLLQVSASADGRLATAQFRTGSTASDPQWLYASVQGVKSLIEGGTDRPLVTIEGKSGILIAKKDIASDNRSLMLLEGNGGQWSDGRTFRTPTETQSGSLTWLNTASNLPTRSGYQFKQWTIDQAGSRPYTDQYPADGLHLYAQWEKSAGKPQKVELDCSTGGRCELTVNYKDSPAKTREFQPGTANLAWSGTPIDGVLLDATGYAADGACSDARCWYVSLKDIPESSASYSAQMPTTGAPDGLSNIGLIALGLSVLGLAVVLARRRAA